MSATGIADNKVRFKWKRTFYLEYKENIIEKSFIKNKTNTKKTAKRQQ
ncbi:hypothetical protein V8V74_15460 [Niallia taxi]|nr:hypothetical protein [Niallia taxi]